MTNGSSDRLDRMEALVESFISASIADRQVSNDRMDRLELAMERDRIASDERIARIEQTLETFSEPLEILLEAATRHEAMIGRLDAILERMIYREGRDGNNDQPQQ